MGGIKTAMKTQKIKKRFVLLCVLTVLLALIIWTAWGNTALSKAMRNLPGLMLLSYVTMAGAAKVLSDRL